MPSLNGFLRISANVAINPFSLPNTIHNGTVFEDNAVPDNPIQYDLHYIDLKKELFSSCEVSKLSFLTDFSLFSNSNLTLFSSSAFSATGMSDAMAFSLRSFFFFLDQQFVFQVLLWHCRSWSIYQIASCTYWISTNLCLSSSLS